MKHKSLIAVIIVTLAALGSVRAARADVAPPQPPPGASIQSGNPTTYVQMVSENVLMEIADYNGPSLWDVDMGLASDKMVGHVEASFNMVNQGTDAETLDVRFPLGTPDGFVSVKTIRNFTASVDGQVAETQTIEQEGEWGYQVPWATWQVTFAPGQTVILDVEYDVHPQGYAPWGTFTYVLETGAGWYGPIDEGTVSFRLPYEVNSLNSRKGNADGSGWSYGPCEPVISGADIVWHFFDLEPTEQSNVQYTVLPPSVWTGITQAQVAVQSDPQSAQAQFQLAHALRSAMSNMTVDKVGGTDIARQAKEAYAKAFELAPDDVDVCVEYLDLMLSLGWWSGDLSAAPEEVLALLEHIKTLAPDDPRVLDAQQRFEAYQETAGNNQQPAGGPTPAPTPTASQPVTPTSVPLVASASQSRTMAGFDVWLAIGMIMIGGAFVIGVALLVAWAFWDRRPVRK